MTVLHVPNPYGELGEWTSNSRCDEDPHEYICKIPMLSSLTSSATTTTTTETLTTIGEMTSTTAQETTTVESESTTTDKGQISLNL